MVSPITFNRYFKIDDEYTWFSQNVYDLDEEQRAVYGNMIVKVKLDQMSQTVDIKIKKSNTKAAFVSMEVNVCKRSNYSINSGEWMIEDFKNWTDACIIDGVFIEIDQLIRKGLHFCVNVELKIYWHGYIANQISPNLFDNMKNYMNKREFSDVKVCVKGKKEYLAHKVILAAQSPMFEKMLTNMKKTQKNCIRFPGIDATVADELMFLYQGKLEGAKKNTDIALKLFEFGIKYQVKNLADCCGFILSDMLTVKNVLKVFELADTNNSAILRQLSFTFILKNYELIKKSNDLVDFSKQNPRLLSEINRKLKMLKDSNDDESDESSEDD